jgi:hypothetical protein
MKIYYCVFCKKIIGECQQGKKGIDLHGVECYECIKPIYPIEDIKREFEKKSVEKLK